MKKFLSFVCTLMVVFCSIFSLAACNTPSEYLSDYEIGYELDTADVIGEVTNIYIGDTVCTVIIQSFTAKLNKIYAEGEYPEGVEYPCEVLIEATGYTETLDAGTEVCLHYYLNRDYTNSFYPTAVIQEDGTIFWQSVFYCAKVVKIGSATTYIPHII